jgi:membrane complex biogenesis BtpA family protein
MRGQNAQKYRSKPYALPYTERSKSMVSIADLKEMFGVGKPILGMVHLPPLPGSPQYGGDMRKVLDRALQDARTLEAGGVDSLIVENFHDIPFFAETTAPETVAAMTLIAYEVFQAVSIPVGINVLRNSWQAAMAIAYTIGGSFIRLNVLTDVLLTDQGLITGPAAQLARYRRFLGAERVKVFADIYCKHGVPLARRPLGVVAKDTVHRAMADAIIISGDESSDPPKVEDIREVKHALPDTPVIIGSGMTPAHVGLLRYADGAIFGYGAKRGGIMSSPVDPQLVREFMQKVREARE